MHRPLGYGNPADQRLSSYRMSMLAHGFVDSEDGDRHEFVPDESSPMSYAVVVMRKGWSVPLAVAAIVIVAVVVLVLVFG
jgi:hypothetical protein